MTDDIAPQPQDIRALCFYANRVLIGKLLIALILCAVAGGFIGVATHLLRPEISHDNVVFVGLLSALLFFALATYKAF